MTTQEHEAELTELSQFFKSAKFPETPFHLNTYMMITDPELFIKMEVSRIERHHGSEVVRDSLFKHLRELKAICLNP